MIGRKDEDERRILHSPGKERIPCGECAGLDAERDGKRICPDISIVLFSSFFLLSPGFRYRELLRQLMGSDVSTLCVEGRNIEYSQVSQQRGYGLNFGGYGWGLRMSMIHAHDITESSLQSPRLKAIRRSIEDSYEITNVFCIACHSLSSLVKLAIYN